MFRYEPTKVTLSAAQLQELWGEDETPGCFSPIPQRAGEWRLEPDGSYRFWREDNS